MIRTAIISAYATDAHSCTIVRMVTSDHCGRRRNAMQTPPIHRNWYNRRATVGENELSIHLQERGGDIRHAHQGRAGREESQRHEQCARRGRQRELHEHDEAEARTTQHNAVTTHETIRRGGGPRCACLPAIDRQSLWSIPERFRDRSARTAQQNQARTRIHRSHRDRDERSRVAQPGCSRRTRRPVAETQVPLPQEPRGEFSRSIGPCCTTALASSGRDPGSNNCRG